MSDEEEERFELEQRLLNSDFNQIPHTPSAWEQDIYDVDEDPDPRGNTFSRIGLNNLLDHPRWFISN